MNVQRHGAVSFRQAGEGLIEFHYRLTERLRLSGAWAPSTSRRGVPVWYQPAGFDDVLERVDVGANPDISVTLYCTPEWLAKAFGAKLEALPPSIQFIMGSWSEELSYKVLPHHAKAARAGETIPEFVRRRRLERAHELLSSTDLQIGLVAAEVGYRHHSTFTAAFAEYFGVPPKSVVNARHAYGKAVQAGV